MSKGSLIFEFGMLCLLSVAFGSLILTDRRLPVSLVPTVEAQDVGGSVNVYRQPKYLSDPIQITKITELGTEIEGVHWMHNPVQGQPIPATENWIENLAISFKNVTDLKIPFVRIRLNFAYSDDTHEIITFWLDLGQVPAGAEPFSKERIPVGTGHTLNLGTGQEMTIPLSGFADQIKAKIERKTSLASVKRCVIGIFYAYFDLPDREVTDWNGILFRRQPGLRWTYVDGWTLPDPDSPGGRRPISTPSTPFFPGSNCCLTRDPFPPKSPE